MEEGLTRVQAIRALNKNDRSVVPADPVDIFYIDYHVDPITRKEFIFWEDVLVAFHDALHVLEPRRVAAMPIAVLDVVVEGPLVHTETALHQGTVPMAP
ncbi:hypothetical protein BGX29_005488 [Mortierella sp. GBA35]|nr:hypothetical protein BGX29_005488 [Mortierella sp. GBA35]